MALTGKGMMIWKIPNCEGGNASKIASVAAAGGFTHVLIKIADGTVVSNKNASTNEDYIPAVVSALRAKGIGAWGWHYVYGYNPTGEAAIAISQTKKYSMDGYVIDAEAEYKLAGRAAVADTFMTALRKGLPSLPIALCSYRWPSYHTAFPWTNFLKKCDLNMPQVYWMSARNPGSQLTRSLTEFKAITPFRPLVPTGPAFKESSWAPTADEVITFMKTAETLGMSAANFFSWDYCHTNLPAIWNAITGYSWSTSSPTPTTSEDITTTLIDALNTRNIEKIIALYKKNSVHIDSESTIQGSTSISNWYTDLLTNKLPSATFKLESSTSTGTTRHFTWTATSSNGNVTDGTDTLGLIDNMIAYHYTFFKISS